MEDTFSSVSRTHGYVIMKLTTGPHDTGDILRSWIQRSNSETAFSKIAIYVGGGMPSDHL